jgi:hypothetical protein
MAKISIWKKRFIEIPDGGGTAPVACGLKYGGNAAIAEFASAGVEAHTVEITVLMAKSNKCDD